MISLPPHKYLWNNNKSNYRLVQNLKKKLYYNSHQTEKEKKKEKATSFLSQKSEETR